MTFLPIMRGSPSIGALMPAAGGGYTFADADAEAYVAEMDVEPDDTRKELIDDLFVSLKADSIYAKITWLSLFAAHDAQAARINAITPTQAASAVNSPTFTTDLGYTGDNATSYLDSGIVASATLSATDMSFFGMIDVACPGGVRKDFIGYSGTRGKINEAAGTTGRAFAYSTLTSTGTSNSANDTFHCVARTGTTQEFSFETTQEDSDTVVTNTTDQGNNIRFLGTATTFTGARVSAAGWGLYLTTTERNNLRTHLRTYLTGTGAI